MRRLILAVLLSMVAARAQGVDYSDVYYNPAESGWGIFVAQSETFQFLAFFIYGQDGKPTWYTAQLTQNPSGEFTGQLFLTNGTYYGSPWNTQALAIAPIGTASFQPTSAHSATLTYALTNGPMVVKSIQRQTLNATNIAGAYVGGQKGAYSGCTDPAVNGSYADRYDLQVTRASSGAVTLQFNYVNGLVCTLSGTPVQTGQLSAIAAANYTCSDGLNTTAGVSEIKATSLGIEGRFAAQSAGQGCREDGEFSAVLK